jgi:hypothetical protein
MGSLVWSHEGSSAHVSPFLRKHTELLNDLTQWQAYRVVDRLSSLQKMFWFYEIEASLFCSQKVGNWMITKEF